MSVKSILLKIGLSGHGVVNYDSSDQRYAWNEMTKHTGAERADHDNFSFAKHRWYISGKDAEGKPTYERKIVISADCLRHNFFIDDFLFQSPNVFAQRDILNKMIASVGSLLRGYMFTQEGQAALKKKSAVAITEAEQTNGAVSSIETFSKSGHREVRVDEDDKADNSFFKRETIGDVTYEATGVVDLKELQFVSLSNLYDRMAVICDDFKAYYKPELEKALGSTIQEPGYYIIKGSAVRLAEYGFMLTKEQVVFLVKELFSRILRTTITKTSNGHATVGSLQIKYVEDPLMDKISSSDGWAHIQDASTVSFEPEIYYEKVDPIQAKKDLEEIEAKQAALKKESKEKKAAEKEAKKAARAAKGV
jgi:hypothetical protein